MKLFASDLDGTLLNKNHQSDHRINEGIEKIFEAGHIFTVCTGRNLSLTRSAGLVDTFLIGMNGACILDKEGRIISSHPMDKETIRLLLFETPYKFEYQTFDEIYTTGDEETFTKIYMQNQRMRNRAVQKNMAKNLRKYHFQCDSFDILSKDIYKVNLHYTHEEMYQEIEELANHYADKIVNAPSVTSLAEITGFGVTKGNAVKELADFLHIRDEDVYVYGDGLNDLSMLKRFEHSYCPSTGTVQAKEAASYQIGPYDEYSVISHMLENL